MQAHRKRLGTGGLGGRGSVRKCRALFCGNNQPVAEHALLMRQAHGAAHEAHVEAMDRLALQAELAVAAGLRGIDGDELADGKPTDTRTQSRDMAGCLMTADDRLAHPHRAETAILIIMQIGAANATCRHGKQHFAGAGGATSCVSTRISSREYRRATRVCMTMPSYSLCVEGMNPHGEPRGR